MSNSQNTNEYLPLQQGFTLGNADIPLLNELWSLLNSEPADFIQRSLHRFSIATKYDYYPDRIVDFMISAEALFVPESNIEIGYKLRTRAACFLNSLDIKERKQRFDLIKKSYDSRSREVHGNNKRSRKPKIKLEELEDFLRCSIVHALRIIAKDNKLSGDERWAEFLDDLVINNRGTS